MGYIRDHGLTKKGGFSSKIYADEILTGEIFATDFYRQFDEYQILLIIACLSYEARQNTEFYETYPCRLVVDLKKKLSSEDYLKREKRFENMKDLTALIQPCYEGISIFEIIHNTNLLEGDVIRIFRQMLDRIGQILNATDDDKLIGILKICRDRIDESMKDIDAI